MLNLDQPLKLESNGTFTLGNNWMESASSVTVACTGCNCWPCSCGATYYVQPTYYPAYYPATYATKIRLTVDDVNKLRAAGRKDAKLKAILQKLTPAIEVEVSFGSDES